MLCALGAEHFPTLALVPMRPVDRAVVVGRQVVLDLLEHQRTTRLGFGRLVVQRDLRKRIHRHDVGGIRDADALHLIVR